MNDHAAHMAKNTRRLRRWHHLIIGTTLMATLTYVLATIPNTKGGLVVDDDSLNFGQVYAQDAFEWSLPIRNTSDIPIRIVRFDTSCRCAGVTPSSVVIPPHEVQHVSLVLDLHDRDPRTIPPVIQPFRVRITAITTDSRRSPSTWYVEGLVRTPLVVSSRTVHFSPLALERLPFTSERVTVRLLEAIDDLEILSNTSEFHVDSTHFDDTYALTITPNSGLPRGIFDSYITLVATPTDTALGHPFTLDISVRGRVAGDPLVTPHPLHFGAVRIGDVVERTLSLSSPEGNPFTVVSYFPKGLENAAMRTVASDTFHTVYLVTVQASAVGYHQGEARFTVTRDMEKETIRVPVIYHGLTDNM